MTWSKRNTWGSIAIWAVMLFGSGWTGQALAAAWSPPEKLVIKWPKDFKAPRMTMERIQETDDFVCEYGKGGGSRFVYAAKARLAKLDMKALGESAAKEGKFEIVEDEGTTGIFTRGGKVAWVSFSIRASPTELHVKAGADVVEFFYKLDVPVTSVTTAKDWQKICNEADDLVKAGSR